MSIDNKKGGAMLFIYSGVFLFFIVVMYIIFNQIVTNNVYNDITNSTDMFNLSASERTEADRALSFWHLTPYILIGVVLVYIFVRMIAQQS